MFPPPALASVIEIQGCIYEFETPNSNIGIKFFQTAAGKQQPNGKQFLEFLKPVRELLESEQIKDIKQLVQRELDDVRIIKSLIPYILNVCNGGVGSGIAFFPSVLGVLMPKGYLNALNINYPLSNERNDNDRFVEDFYNCNNLPQDSFNWSVKQFKDEKNNLLAFSSLSIDTDKCDIVIIDGQHRVNAFRAACGTMNNNNYVLNEIYDNCGVYPDEIKVNLPITLVWFEMKAQDVSISPEIISRKLFIDVNNTAKGIATSRKILLDDRNPVNLITNHFYSKIAETYGFKLNSLSLAHLGFDVPSEVSQEGSLNSIPFIYITTPERLKHVFDSFFVRGKSFSLANGVRSPKARKMRYSSSVNTENNNKRILNEMLPNSSALCIDAYEDEYLDTTFLLVKDELIEIHGDPKISKQDFVRNEFERIYFGVFYKLFSQFNFFADHISKVADFHEFIQENGNYDKKDTWKKVFLDGKSLFFTLKNDSQIRNKYRSELDNIEQEFIKEKFEGEFEVYTSGGAEEKIKFPELFLSFRTLAFQIGYSMAFFEYCKVIHNCNFSTIENETLIDYCGEFVEAINKFSNSEWANCFEFVRDLQGEFHPKFFPVITHLILRKIQTFEQHYYTNDENKYMAPECIYFHEKAVEEIKKLIGDNFTSTQIRNGLDWILQQNINGQNCKVLFDQKILAKKTYTENVFKKFLKIESTYLDVIYPSRCGEIYKSILKR